MFLYFFPLTPESQSALLVREGRHTEPALCTSLAEPGGAMALGDGSDALPRSGQRLGLRVSGAS
jgi:hypothetical protein